MSNVSSYYTISPTIPNKTVKDIAHKIGAYYLQKNNNDPKKAIEEIERLQIFNLEVSDNLITVYTSRPGLFIGPYGRNIETIAKYLEKPVHIIEVGNSLLDELTGAAREEQSWQEERHDKDFLDNL